MPNRYDRIFEGKKSRTVGQRKIDDHVAEAHGPDSVPRRTSEPPCEMTAAPDESADESTEESADESTEEGTRAYDRENGEDTTIEDLEKPPPISTRLGDRFRDAYAKSG